MDRYPFKTIESCYGALDKPDAFRKAAQAAIESLHGTGIARSNKTKSPLDLEHQLMARLKAKGSKLQKSTITERRMFIRALIEMTKVQERLYADLKQFRQREHHATSSDRSLTAHSMTPQGA